MKGILNAVAMGAKARRWFYLFRDVPIVEIHFLRLNDRNLVGVCECVFQTERAIKNLVARSFAMI